MSLYESVLRPMLFRLDPESAHEMAMGLIRRGVLRARSFSHPILEEEFFGRRFANPLGLAAGFDKNGVAVAHWAQLGFGLAEIGTVTRHAQPGNPKPRLFRLPEDKALINRLGFNNDGAEAMATRLASVKSTVPLGINLGKSKVTPVEEAASDYEASYRALKDFGDYFVVNVSSPNTPGLRSLQERGPLIEILSAMQAIDTSKPIFVKVAPDLEFSALDEIVEVALERKIAGLIATNTTIGRHGIPPERLHSNEQGGLSGAPLKRRSDEVLAHLHQATQGKLILIGVGGIFTAQDLFDKIALGAHLCQVYTGWVYGGPHWVPNVLEDFVGLLAQAGVKSLDDLRGTRSLSS